MKIGGRSSDAEKVVRSRLTGRLGACQIERAVGSLGIEVDKLWLLYAAGNEPTRPTRG